MTARLENQYNDDIVGNMMKEFGYSNVMEVPKIQKISVNIGLGDAVQNSKLIDGAVAQLTQITGQHPIVTRARKSIATFKLREGMPIGVKVTLRRNHMYEFLDRLINIALPRVRDFRGISAKAFDGRGNYTLGI
jgi:large subunit ribosomal protein L5